MTDTAKQEIPPEEDIFAEAEDAPQADPIAELTEQLALQAEEIAKFKDQYLRAVAETENVRTRARRDLEDSSRYAAAKFARDMVGVIENFQRASSSITADARAGNPVLKQVGDGLDMSMQELLSVFERNGIKRIDPAGQKFDHNFHQAVAQVPTADVPPGTVLQVLDAGYVLHDRLLKPAMVTVSTKPADASA